MPDRERLTAKAWPHFEKWQGLGNDFILVTGVAPLIVDAPALCDRRRGIGGDGVLIVDLAEGIAMTVLNADGSRPEMCGNGLRCVAAWAHAELGAVRPTIVTDAGPRACEVSLDAPGRYSVGAAMGQVTITGSLEHAGRTFTLVDVGNPHAVCFEPMSREERLVVGPAVERLVPGGVNVELCTLHDEVIEVSVYERGVGWTDACGTGACAVAAAAVTAGTRPGDTALPVRLPGGTLAITIDAGMQAHMRGPAERVFVGQLPLPSG